MKPSETFIFFVERPTFGTLLYLEFPTSIAWPGSQDDSIVPLPPTHVQQFYCSHHLSIWSTQVPARILRHHFGPKQWNSQQTSQPVPHDTSEALTSRPFKALQSTSSASLCTTTGSSKSVSFNFFVEPLGPVGPLRRFRWSTGAPSISGSGAGGASASPSLASLCGSRRRGLMGLQRCASGSKTTEVTRMSGVEGSVMRIRLRFTWKGTYGSAIWRKQLVFWWLGGEPWKPNMLRYFFGVCFIVPAKARTHLHGRHMGRFLQCFSATLSLGYVQKKRLANVHAHCTYPLIAKTWFVPIYLYKVDTLKGSTSKKASWYEVGFPPFCLRPTPPASIFPRCASNVLSSHG